MLYLIEFNNKIYGVYNDNNIIVNNMKFLNINNYIVYGFNLNQIHYINVKTFKKIKYDFSQIFILKTNNDYIGLFSTLEKAKEIITFLKKIGLECNFIIKKCYLNSLNVEDITNTKKITNNYVKQINKEDEKLRFEKYELNKQLNELKIYEKKMENKKKEYDTDLKLYKLFKKKLDEEKNFIMPELFVNKYKIFLELEEKNELNFNNYNKYIFNNYNGKYKSLF